MVLLSLFLVASNAFMPSVRGDPTNLNFSLLIFEDTGTAGNRSDDTKRSFSGIWSDYSACTLDQRSTSKHRVATQFTKVGEINKIRVCWRRMGSLTGNAYIRIETDSSNTPSGTLADSDGQITVDTSGLSTTASWCEYTFSGPVTLSSSSWYWVVVRFDEGGSDMAALYVYGATGGTSACYLPANIPRGGVYVTSWAVYTWIAYVAFVIPETGHALPLYAHQILSNDPALVSGNNIAELPNDPNKVYRIVLQIQPIGSLWDWAPNAAGNEKYYIVDADSSGKADINGSGSQLWRQFAVQKNVGNGAKYDVFVSGNQASEWDGKTSITLTECGDVSTYAEGDGGGQTGVYSYDGTQWWNTIVGTISQNNWVAIEYWFKLNSDWSVNDIAELRFTCNGENGYSNLAGLRFRLKVIFAPLPEFPLGAVPGPSSPVL